MNTHERAQNVLFHIRAAGGIQPGETIEDLTAAVGETDPRVVEILIDAQRPDGTFRDIVDPADAGAREKTARAKAG